MIYAADKPGLGAALREEVLQRPDVHIEILGREASHRYVEGLTHDSSERSHHDH